MESVCQESICDKKSTGKIAYALSIVNKFYDNYGKRAEEAAQNKNIDWRAVSHAIRAAYQVKEIFEEGTITFPLKHADFIKDVKFGCLDFPRVSDKLESLIAECKDLSDKSTFPEKVDIKFWDNFIISAVEEYVI